MYAPVGILFCCPMFDLEVGSFSSIATASISCYPAVDPLPTMFIVESYRKAIFGCCKSPQSKMMRSVVVSMGFI
ncbi:hypothetical protein L5515_007092 [Caenorhabditis briggsae]|uniref:Uncharacterized protein n=1 Tax=Caenorhabditis briggsae TaxID=6238 RepID=A0AAE9F3S0_CAEBR|nr:hypothetical protein L5515_007092 [Caenorhabditis briggsae]